MVKGAYHKGQDLTIEDLELFAREGAKLLLTAGLEAEVSEFLQRSRYERSQDVLEGERLKWQGVRMKAEDIAWIEDTVKALEAQPLEAEFSQVLAGVSVDDRRCNRD